MSAQPLVDLVIQLKLDGSTLGPDAQRLGSDIGAVSPPAEAAAASIAVVDRAAQKFMQTLESQAQSLKDEAATIGMTSTEMLSYRASLLGISDAAAPLISQIAQEEAALKALRDSTSSASTAVNAFGETEAEASARIRDMVARSLEAQAAMNATASAAASSAAGVSAFGASSDQVRATIAAQNAAMSATGREMASLNEQMEAFRATAAQGVSSFQELYQQFDRLDLLMAKGKMSMEEYDAAAAALWKDEDRLMQQVNALTARYDPLDAATRKLAADQALLDDAYKNGQVTTAQYQKALAGIQADQAAVQLRSLAEQEAQLERALKSGQVSWSDYKKSLSDINASKAGLSEIAAGAKGGASAMDSLGLHTASARKEIVTLAHEALTGSWSNFGSSLMVLAERMDLMAALTSPLAIGVTAVAVGIGALAVAAYKGYEESEHLNNALAATANYAGVTSGQVDDMAQRIGQSSGTVTEAQKALAGLVASGKVSGSALESVGAASVAMSEATGENVDKVVAQFVAMSDDVAKGAEKMNEQYHFLTLAQYDEIKALEEHGDKAAAMKLTADALTTSLANQKVPLGALPQLLKDAEKSWSDFWRAAMNAGKPETPADAVNTARAAVEDFQQQIDGLKSAGVTPNSAVMGHLASLQQNLSTAGQEAAQHADSAGIQSMLAQQQDDGIEASKHIDELKKNLRSRQQIRDDEIASIHKYYAQARAAAQANPDQLDPANYSVDAENATVAAAIAKNKSGSSNAEATGNRDAANLKAEIAAQEQQLALMDQYTGSQAKVTDGDKKVLQIEQQLGLAQKDRIGKVTDAQLNEQLGLAQNLAGLEKEVQARKNAADATKAYNGQLDKWADDERNAMDALGQERDLVDKGAESQKLMGIELQAVSEARAKILKQQADGKPMGDDEVQSLLANAAAHGKVMASIMGESDARKAAVQLQQENEKFAANSIADETQRNNALVAIDAKKWQDLIANAGDGTEAQKKLIEQYDQWLQNQYNKPLIDQWKKTIDGIGTDFHDGFLQMLENGKSGWESFTKSLENTFETTVVSMLYETFAKKYIVQVVADIAGVVSGDEVKDALLGNSGSTGAASGLFNLNGLSNAYNTVAGWFGGGSSSPESSYGVGQNTYGFTTGIPSSSNAYGVGSNTYGFTASSGSGTAIGSSLAGIGAGIGIGDAISGGNSAIGSSPTTTTAIGTMAGAYIGSAFPVIGTALGAVIGGALGGVANKLFGGGETRSGALYDSTPGGVINKLSGPSGGDPAADQVQQEIASTYTQMQQLATSLGGSVTGLGDYRAGYEVSPGKGNSWVRTGFGDDVTTTSLSGVKDSTTVLNDLSLAMQQSVIKGLQEANLDKPYADYLSQFDSSKLTADQVTQIETTLNELKSLFDSIKTMGSDFDNLKNASTSAQLAVINLSGGIDQFNTNASYFEQHFVPAAEQTANQAKAVTDQLAALGESGVTTNDQFRQVVQGIDLTTDAGQQLYAQMLALAPAFDQMTQAAQAAADAQQSLWNNYYSAVYTSDQQAAVSQGQLQAKFDALGVAMPKTNAEFQALVENMDTSTQPMKDLQNALLALAPTFGQVAQAAQQAQADAQAAIGAAQKTAISTLSSSAQSLYTDRTNASSLLDSINSSITGSDADTSGQIGDLWSEMTGGGVSLTQQIDLATQLNDLVTKRYQTEQQAMTTLVAQSQQLLSYVQGLKIGDLSSETPSEKLADAAQQYADTLARAQGGDQTAIGNLSGAADNYLKLAQTYYASSDTYTQIFGSVTSQLSAFGDALQSQGQSSDQLSQQSLDQLMQLRDIVSGQAASADTQYQGVMSQLAQQLGTLDAIEQAAGIQSEVPSILQGLPGNIAAALAGIIGTGAATGGDQITSLYQSVLGRTPTASEVSYWTDSFANGSKTLADFQYSADQELINDAYQQILGRTADSGGLQFYTGKLYNGTETLDQIKADLKNSLVNGSHAGGADYIPFDGYRAELHKGEAVITSANNQKLAKLLSGDWSQYGRSDNAALIAEVKALNARIGQLETALVQATQQNAAVVAAATTQSAQTITSSAQKTAEINQRAAMAKPALV